MRTRLTFLVVTLAVAVIAVACGRASKSEIDAALGITPTVTLSADQIATSTAAAAVAVGDITQGKVQYGLRCMNCHRVNSPTNAPVLAGADNPATQLTNDELIALVRTGEGHGEPGKPPGPIKEVTISQSQLLNIIAFIRDQSK